MQQIEKFKDVTIEGREFRIGRIPALQGGWIVRQMAVGIAGMGQEAYSTMQHAWLEAVSVYKDSDGVKTPMKVFAAGKWLIPELGLEYDLDTIHGLFEAVTDFNFGYFFRKRAEEIQAESAAVDDRAVAGAGV